MAAKTKCPKGFIEVHCINAYHVDKFPTIVNAKMISFVNVREVETDAYRKTAKALCHIMVLGHNNGGFNVAESYEDVVKAIAKALEETT